MNTAPAPPTIEIRYYIDIFGGRFAQYRVRGGNRLDWIPMGRYVAQKAITDGVFHGAAVEHVADVYQGPRINP